MSSLLQALYRGNRATVDELLAADPSLDVFEAAAVGRTDTLRELLDPPERIIFVRQARQRLPGARQVVEEAGLARLPDLLLDPGLPAHPRRFLLGHGFAPPTAAFARISSIPPVK